MVAVGDEQTRTCEDVRVRVLKAFEGGAKHRPMCSFTRRLTVPFAALAAALGALAAEAAVAAAPRTGPWAGATAQRQAVSFAVRPYRATPCSGRCPAAPLDIVKFAYKIREHCSDGGTDTSHDVISYLDVGAGGSFSFTDSRPYDYLQIRAWLNGSSGSGTVTVVRRFNTKGVIDPHGTIVCRSGVVRWKAHRS
jgi:hypothetical protein